jgi:hypothetical protein
MAMAIEVNRGDGIFCSTICYHISRRRPLEDRFWEKVDKNGPIPEHCPNLGPCWLWMGSKSVFGYGTIHDPSSTRKGGLDATHRSSWRLHFGAIPDGLKVLHKCDVPSCVNPAHLFLGTLKDNTQDMLAKGRHRLAPNHSKGEKNPAAKLTEEQVATMRDDYAAGISRKQLAIKFKISRSMVYLITTTNPRWRKWK